MTDFFREHMEKLNRFKELVDSQAQILLDTDKQVVDTALTWHRENCPKPDGRCENTFLESFLTELGSKIAQAPVPEYVQKVLAARENQNDT